MGQNVSVEAAFPFFRQRVSELQDEALILRGRVAELEAELEQARAATQPTPPPIPGLGAAPAEQATYSNHTDLDQH